MTIPSNKPPLQLTDTDGNAFAVLGHARRAARAAGWSDEEWKEFQTEAQSGDYDNLLATCMKFFDVS